MTFSDVAVDLTIWNMEFPTRNAKKMRCNCDQPSLFPWKYKNVKKPFFITVKSVLETVKEK
jgi:hypothetical protein